MAKGEKVLVLGRHGKHKDNILVPEAIKQAYNFGQSLRKKYFPRGISSKNILMLHSGQPRAEDTGKSILTGISNIQLPPNSQKDLERLSEDGFFDKFIISRAALLGYDHLDFNDDEIDTDEEKYMKIWAADPNSTDFKGKHITCYNEMIRRGQAFLVDEINEMISNKYRLGLFPSHLSIVEQIFTAGINSARDTPATLEDIGGVFKSGECAELILEKDKDGTYTQGTFRRDNKYDVNLTKLLAVCEE